MKRKLNLIFTVLFLIMIAPAKGQSGVFSSGAWIKGTVGKITLEENGSTIEVWGFPTNEDGDEYCDPPGKAIIIFRHLNGDYYKASKPISDYIPFAKEGDVLEVEGSWVMDIVNRDWDDSVLKRYFVVPTRISAYNRQIEGELSLRSNPAQTMPKLPGLVFSIKENGTEQEIMIVDLFGSSFFDGDQSYEGIDILGTIHQLGEQLKVIGVLSLRKDLQGIAYLDIKINECTPLSIPSESADAENVISFEWDSDQVTVHSTKNIKEIKVYDLNGRVVYQKCYNHVVEYSSFRVPVKENLVASVVTEEGKRYSKVILIQK